MVRRETSSQALNGIRHLIIREYNSAASRTNEWGVHMALTREEVEHIAQLARLALSEDEKEMFRSQLSAILSYAERLQELDTDAIPPTAHAVDVQGVMRDDVVRPSLPRDAALANAPQAQDGFVIVPTVLEEHA